MKTQNYLELSQMKIYFYMHQKSNHCRMLMYMYVNNFDTAELHLYRVVTCTLKLDSVKH
jgi:hypothetical protein